jgi:hypothetical protein
VYPRASRVDASELQQLSCVVDYARGGGSSGAVVSDGGCRTDIEATCKTLDEISGRLTCWATSATGAHGAIDKHASGASGVSHGAGSVSDSSRPWATVPAAGWLSHLLPMSIPGISAIWPPPTVPPQTNPLVTKKVATRERAASRAVKRWMVRIGSC